MRQADILCRVVMPLPCGGLTSGSTRLLGSFPFIIEFSDDGRMLLARSGLSLAIGTQRSMSYVIACYPAGLDNFLFQLESSHRLRSIFSLNPTPQLRAFHHLSSQPILKAVCRRGLIRALCRQFSA